MDIKKKIYKINKKDKLSCMPCSKQKTRHAYICKEYF